MRHPLLPAESSDLFVSRKSGRILLDMEATQPILETPVHDDVERFLTPGEVARLVGVSPTTVTRWAREGKLRCRTTLGGHRRFEPSVVKELQVALEAHRQVS